MTKNILFFDKLNYLKQKIVEIIDAMCREISCIFFFYFPASDPTFEIK